MDTKLGTLSLDQTNPDAKTLTGDWQDGQEYDITLHVKQTAPGAFDVMSATEAETPTDSASPAGAGGASEKMPKGVGVLIASAGKGE